MSEQGTAVVSVSAGRFPWVPAFEERFNVGKAEWRALTDAVFPNAKSLDSIVLALAYCKARRLDVFKRPVHIVPMWSTAANNGKGGMIDTIWPGIGELRTTAVRTGDFGGRDAAVWGPDIESNLGKATIKHPEWCEVIIYRMVNGHRVACHGPRVYWAETYAWSKRDDATPNSMWSKRPRGQLEKCAEAAALRAAFPEEIGNEYCADEMEGRVIDGQFQHVEQQTAPAAALQNGADKLAAFARENAEDAPADEAVNRAALKATLERIELARDPKAFKAARNEAIKLMGKFDETWPEGKQQITEALAQAEQRTESPTAGERAGTADSENADGAGVPAREHTEEA